MQEEERIEDGSLLKIDIYSVMVRSPIPMVEESTSPAEVVDLTSDTPVVRHERRRFGGRFWVLAQDDGDEDSREIPSADKPKTIATPVSSSSSLPPTDEVLRKKIKAGGGATGHRRKATTMVQPWVGPLPKVGLPKLTLSDFMDSSSWKIVRSKKQWQRRWRCRRRSQRMRSGVFVRVV